MCSILEKEDIQMAIGSFVLVLHSHLPYCRKAGVWPFGEEWVFEAMAETYIPLLDTIDYLADKNSLGSFTVGFTPVLLDQLQIRTCCFGSTSIWRLKSLQLKLIL
jgi:predicted glycosyl hydrolase (DUF1957 family)